jgi:SAM-dependent methyltransferase
MRESAASRKGADVNTGDPDRAFAGSIPQLYERYLVPLIFQPYADDMAWRVAQRQPSRVLEVAAGTGVVTRRLADTLSSRVAIIATDINQPMLDQAMTAGTSRPVQWRQADAMQLPFSDEDFDVVVCQFAAMFFPDKPKAFAEARRVLRPGGWFVFSVWDRIEDNEFADTVTQALAAPFAENPPRFLARFPHGYHDRSAIAAGLAGAGFDRLPEFSTLAFRSRAESPHIPAVAYCQGTPLRSEIEAHGPSLLEEATDIATAAIASRFGSDTVDGKIQAHVITIER